MTLIVDGKTLTDDKDIADGINNYFCTIGSKISSKIKSPGHFTDYLKNKINNTFFISPVVEAEVSRELAKLNPKKASGPDNITTKIVTSCASQLTAPLTRIYNRGINEACFPCVWKLAKVVALYKKKYHFLPENYRPISLLNCFGKIFEKLISKQMVLFIENTLYLSIWFSEKAFDFTSTDWHSGQNKRCPWQKWVCPRYILRHHQSFRLREPWNTIQEIGTLWIQRTLPLFDKKLSIKSLPVPMH